MISVWLLVLVVCGAAVLLGPVWTELNTLTLQTLFHLIGSTWVGYTVVTAVAECAPSHVASLLQAILAIASFY